MRAVIVGGAPISEYDECKKYLGTDDFYIFCDSGLYHKEKLGITPNLIIGDFDSHEKPDADCQIITLPREKDDTDTVYAAKEAVKRGFDNFLFLGTVGARLDHSIANLSILFMLDEMGKQAFMIDDYSVICLVTPKAPALISKKFPYFSLLNIYGRAEGVTIKGAKYNIENQNIFTEYQYAVSNEIEGDFASVTIKNGKLLLIRVKKC